MIEKFVTTSLLCSFKSKWVHGNNVKTKIRASLKSSRGNRQVLVYRNSQCNSKLEIIRILDEESQRIHRRNGKVSKSYGTT